MLGLGIPFLFGIVLAKDGGSEGTLSNLHGIQDPKIWGIWV
jgi:hypothetical protein